MNVNKQTASITSGEPTPKRLKTVSPNIKEEPSTPGRSIASLLDSYHQVPKHIIEEVKKSRYRQGCILPTLQLTKQAQAENAAEAFKILLAPCQEYEGIVTDLFYMNSYLEKYWPAKNKEGFDVTKINRKTTNLTASREELAACEQKSRRRQILPHPNADTETQSSKGIDLTKDHKSIVQNPTIFDTGKRVARKQSGRIPGIYSYTCLYCSKFFCDVSKFIHHICSCPVCKLHFHRGILDHHYQHTHKEKVHKCEICLKQYLQEIQLLQHKRAEH